MPSTSKPANTGPILSDMIQTSAKADCGYIGVDPAVFCVRFRHHRYARAFQDAFESFVHAAKRTVKNVRARERAEHQAARASS